MNTFKDLTLPEELQKALLALNFTKPTAIQTAAIPIGLDRKDIIACAETGSGKTAAYAIPMLTKIIQNQETSSPSNALILVPTRELAQQISEVLRKLTHFSEGMKVASLIGGQDIRKQFQSLKRNPQIIVATPGRLTDHLHKKTVSLKSTTTLILDEGDRMLDMGFAPQLDQILNYLPRKRQTMLFSATLSGKVEKLATKYLNKPKQINIGRTSLPVAAIKQSVIQLSFKDKDDRLVDELNKRSGSVIVFLRTKNRTDILYKILSEYGFAVDLIHGDRTQGQRNKAIRNFKEGKSRILCATDVAARGIDIPQVAHVINFDLPMMDEDYVHRIGRTARNGADGEAVSFVTPQEHVAWLTIARKYRIQGVELRGVGAGPPLKGQKKTRHGRGDNPTNEKKRGFKGKKKFSKKTTGKNDGKKGSKKISGNKHSAAKSSRSKPGGKKTSSQRSWR